MTIARKLAELEIERCDRLALKCEVEYELALMQENDQLATLWRVRFMRNYRQAVRLSAKHRIPLTTYLTRHYREAGGKEVNQ